MPLGLLLIEKSDFEAVAGMRRDDWFKAALDIRKVPSKETLRRRSGKHAQVLQGIVNESLIEMLKAVGAPAAAETMGCVPLDIDVFLMDNSDTRKEGVP